MSVCVTAGVHRGDIRKTVITWIQDDPPGFNASIYSSLGLYLHFLSHLQAGVGILGQLLHGTWVSPHVHQDVWDIKLGYLHPTDVYSSQ